MVDLFTEVIKFEGVNFVDHLERLGIYFVFETVMESDYFDDNVLKIKVCQYVAYGHSIESRRITMGGDRRKELSDIFKFLGIDSKFYDSIVLMKNPAVVKSIQRWLDKKDSRQIEFLFTLNNAYVQQQAGSLADLKKSDLINTDYDQKFKCIEHMTDLKKMIKDAESELQQSDPKLKEAYQDVKKAASKVTVGIEHFSK